MFVPSQVRRKKRRREKEADEEVSWGADSFKGGKDWNEDRASCRKMRNGAFGFAVFDGHGGHLASDFLNERLWDYVEDDDSALIESFRKADVDFLRTFKDASDGSCALVALYHKNRLRVATVGDSRALLLRGTTVVRASSQHNPESEKVRIEKAGGCVVNVRGIPRVTSPVGLGFGGPNRNALYLAVSRSFGDRELKPFGVVPDPQVRTFDLDDRDSILVLVSDGVTDVLDDRAIMDHAIRRLDDPQVAAKNITRDAFHKGSDDNVTAVVVRLPSAPTRAGNSQQHFSSLLKEWDASAPLSQSSATFHKCDNSLETVSQQQRRAAKETTLDMFG